jgi:hypothetical protein
MLRSSLSLLVLAGSLGGALNAAHAAELGEVRVSSHIGQPLVADIELAMVDDPAAPVSVRLASPEVYNGAGIATPPVLASVNLSVMKRDGRQFLHVTSLRPVGAEHVHLYLELVDKGQRTVRLATLWLTADPNPAPIPVPAARVEPAPAAAPVAAALPVAKPTAMRKLEAAAVAAEEEGVKHPQPAPAKPRPAARPLAAIAHPEPKAAAPLVLPIHAPQSAAPGVCAQQAEQAKVCAALDGKSAALKAQIGALEGKVKSLQAKLGVAPVAPVAPVVPAAPGPHPAQAAAHPSQAVPASASASASASAPEPAHEPPGPKPISAIKPLVPRKPKAPPPEPDVSLPWGWIGGGTALLLALGGALLLLRRRTRTVANVDIPTGPRLAERLRHSFASSRNAAPAAAVAPAEEAVEPSFD